MEPTIQDATQVNVTTNYDQFQFIETNREANRGHIEALKRAFEETGNLTRVQPILVNDRMEIIDGQHRFIAAKELNQPVYYTAMEGLGINEARSMNILHRSWNIEDYAISYSKTDPNYKKYLDIKEDYGFNHSITLLYIIGAEDKGIFRDFKNGQFVLQDEAAARDRLDKLASAGEFVPMVNDRYFAKALLAVIKIPGYDHKRMLNKLSINQDLQRRYASVGDYQRMLEEIYNHRMSEASRLRLF